MTKIEVWHLGNTVNNMCCVFWTYHFQACEILISFLYDVYMKICIYVFYISTVNHSKCAQGIESKIKKIPECPRDLYINSFIFSFICDLCIIRQLSKYLENCNKGVEA